MSIKSTINFEEARKFIMESSLTSIIYVGTDSECYRKLVENPKTKKREYVWFADYSRVIAVRKDGNKGSKLFGDVVTERIYDQNKARPSMRLMTEVRMAADVYNEIVDVIGDRKAEIHLDINEDEKHGSYHVMKEAIGYIRGMCGIEPHIKPDSPCASFCADRFKEIIHMTKHGVPEFKPVSHKKY